MLLVKVVGNKLLKEVGSNVYISILLHIIQGNSRVGSDYFSLTIGIHFGRVILENF